MITPNDRSLAVFFGGPRRISAILAIFTPECKQNGNHGAGGVFFFSQSAAAPDRAAALSSRKSERTLKLIGMGRVNWLFLGSDQGGQTAAATGRVAAAPLASGTSGGRPGIGRATVARRNPRRVSFAPPSLAWPKRTLTRTDSRCCRATPGRGCGSPDGKCIFLIAPMTCVADNPLSTLGNFRRSRAAKCARGGKWNTRPSACSNDSAGRTTAMPGRASWRWRRRFCSTPRGGSACRTPTRPTWCRAARRAGAEATNVPLRSRP